MKGVLFDIQRGCVDDGPGVRTTVFLKGCPLNCLWCHNPESKSMAVQVYPDNGRVVGREVEAAAVLEEVLLDRSYFDASGGMTVSGGEPLMQPAFTLALLSGGKEAGIHTCVETSGFAPWPVFEALMPVTDLFLFDIKVTPERHRQFTGVGSEEISANFDRLYRVGAEIVVRCPIVPGHNDTEAHFAYLNALCEARPRLVGLQMMPYHNLGVGKAKRLGLPVPLSLENPSGETQAIWRERLKCDEWNWRAIRAQAPAGSADSLC